MVLFFKKNTIINNTHRYLLKKFLIWKINKEKRNKFYRLLNFIRFQKILLFYINGFRKRNKIKNSIFDYKNTKSFKKIFQKNLTYIIKNDSKKIHEAKKFASLKLKSLLFSKNFDNYIHYNKNSHQKILIFQKKRGN